MYEDSVTAVKCAVGTTDWFKVEVELHQGSAVSPFLFALSMDRLTDKVRQESPWTMMFADDTVICGESREQVGKNLERWRAFLSLLSDMDDSSDSLMKKEFLSVRVRDPRFHKEDFWHTHIDYEIYLHTNSMCFQKKTSCVRRRYSEFVWLRQRLQDNALLVQVPKLSPAKPFFSLNNRLQVVRRMEGLQKFLEATSSSGLGISAGPTPPIEMSFQNGNPAQQVLAMVSCESRN
ncbi:sorting nexin-10A [Silurus asotus]|uniref:Sorting nexin-10A n=1 Tax=Silurus asotus TaxID=30991 RepID=A0AAD5B7Q4_SILAS|nr:sorting nexin-10A [Silurus asotus]